MKPFSAFGHRRFAESLTFALALAMALGCLSPAFAQAWRDPLGAGQRAYQNGDFAGAIRHFDAVRSALGDPYERDEAGNPWSRDERDAYDATRCPRALSVLALSADSAAGASRGDAGEDSRDDAHFLALDQADFACDEDELAVAALLNGDPLQAALRLSERGRTRFIAPFAERRLPAEVSGFALQDGELPPAADLEDARRFVTAHAQLRHGLVARCYAARGIRWRPPGAYSESDNEVMDDLPEIAPFTGEQRDALATIRCDYPLKVAPEERGYGDGLDAIAYLLRRESDGRITVRGSFPDFPSLDCWTAVVLGEVSNYAHEERGFYAFVRAFGYSTPDGPERIVVTTHLCDINRRRCRSFPVEVRQGEYHYDSNDEAQFQRYDWRSDFAIRRGRIVLTNTRGAPSGLRRFRRGMPARVFFSSPSVEYTLPDLSAPVQPARECPVFIADPDGNTNVRERAASRSGIVGQIDSGSRVEVEERRGRWWRISAPRAGWIWGPNTETRCTN